MSLRFVSRRFAAVFFLFAAPTVTSCSDPAPQPRVHITLRGLATAYREPFERDSLSVELRFASSGADASSGEVRRGIYWNHDDPFEFDVQLPAGTYATATAELKVYLQCPSTGIVQLVAARGTTSAPFDVHPTGSNAPAPITMTGVPTTCQ